MILRELSRNRRRGFTLIELLVVMFILVMLAGAVTVLVTKRVEDAKHARAVTDIETLKGAIDLYHMDNGEYPAALDALRNKPTDDALANSWNGPYIKKAVPNDPWNHEYIYNPQGEHNTDSYDLSTLGRDGKEGGSGNDADVTNWDETNK